MINHNRNTTKLKIGPEEEEEEDDECDVTGSKSSVLEAVNKVQSGDRVLQ